MTTLYHITPLKNLQSINEHGLIPAFQKGLFCGDREDRKLVVWLTDNPKHILRTQAGSKWCLKHSPVVIKVDCNGLDIKQYMSYVTGMPVVVPHEYYVDHTIKQHFGVEE
jgi:RNA:NAD 2'-phosphotransferase (TPT1/KptA family)